MGFPLRCLAAVLCALTMMLTPAWAQTKLKVAVVMPGTIQDLEYNWLGTEALKAVAKTGHYETAYSEKVTVPDVARVMREYIASGHRVIWAHGAQFNNAVFSLADSQPEVSFIIETEPRPAANTVKPNIWYLDRNRHTGFYLMGVAASMVTKAQKIGYIGGVPLPFYWSELNAIRQALKDNNSKATISPIVVGDFNDPVKAKQSAEVLIAAGCDVLVSQLSLGNTGVIQAVKEAKNKVYLTTSFTSRRDQIPGSYLTADLYDFSKPLVEIAERIRAGTKGGYYLMEYGPGKARSTELPIANVDAKTNATMQQIVNDVASGKRTVVLNSAKD
jgi:basic membrane protein A and related proteins